MGAARVGPASIAAMGSADGRTGARGAWVTFEAKGVDETGRKLALDKRKKKEEKD